MRRMFHIKAYAPHEAHVQHKAYVQHEAHVQHKDQCGSKEL